MAERRKYEVGYGKPPEATRFQKGRSGNPAGKPKGARSVKADLEDELKEEVEITEGGRTVKLRKQRLLLKSLVTRAIKGDVRAAARILDTIDRMRGPGDADDQKDLLLPEDEEVIATFLRQRDSEDHDGG